MPNHLISLLILFSCSWVFAQEQINTDLAHHPHWLKLLHYSSRLLGPARSDITSKDYFLASDGETNPKAELVKTVQGLKESEEIYCRFPSRRMWLEKQGYTFPTRSCAEFEQWTRNHSVQSVSLIFATGFLGNPASYFGHPLMKFNFKDERSPLDLLDTAINYGAFTPPDVGPLPYAIKGIFGGYDAGFTSADFFFHKNNYSELELRNMWEYELSLTSDQVTELVAHLWDLRGAKITYYFFRDNCAFRMSDLLELILDKQFNTAGIPYAIPSTLFHRLHDLKLVKDIRIIKSRQARLREKVLSLTEEEKDLLKMITEDVGRIQSEEFKSVSNDEKSRVLEVAIDYFAYQLILDKAEAAKESKRKLLQARVALPPKTHDWHNLQNRPPHETQKPVLTQFGYFHSEYFGDAASFRFRPVFYDLISPDSGRPELSSLSVFDLEMNGTDEKLWLKSFNLIAIENLNVSKTGLKGDGGYAWRFRLGADQMNLACISCLVPRFEVGIGKAWEFSRLFVFYGMIDPRIQSNHEGSGFLSATPSVATLITFSDHFRIHASTGRRFYLDKEHAAESIHNIEGRIGSERNWDVRLSFQEHIDRRYGLAYGRYW